MKAWFSYHDLAHEVAYHVFVYTYLLLATLGSGDYEAISNQETGLGRSDVGLIHVSDGTSYVFEFQKKGKKSKRSLDLCANDALVQIAEKEYFIKIEEKKPKLYFRVGLGFEGKTLKSKIQKCVLNNDLESYKLEDLPM